MIKQWSRLDNAAKIFPAAQNKRHTQVYRFSCELKKDIDKNFLQQATESVLVEFELFQSVLRRGLFWYYLEKSDLKPIVKEEYQTPCAAIYEKNRENLLFEVTYYKNRINLEVFHVLSDGAGAMHFLRTLIARYLHLTEQTEQMDVDYDASYNQKQDDSFLKYYSGKLNFRLGRRKAAYKIKGWKVKRGKLKVITGIMNVDQVLTQAHKYQATITTFFAAILIKSIIEGMPERIKKKRPITVLIPVNLRKFFPSVTARNFFVVTYLKYELSKQDESFESIIRSMNEQMKNNLIFENLRDEINANMAIERNLPARLVPLAIKDIFLKAAYMISGRAATIKLSNVGIIEMPSEFVPHIKRFDIYTGTDGMQVCSCSFGGRLTLGFSSQFISSDIEMLFFRKLADMGINIEITSNIEEGE